MLKILRYLNIRELCFIFLSVIFVTVQVWLDLKLPDYMSEITKILQSNGGQFNIITSYGKLMLFCAFGSLISSLFVGYFASVLAASFSKRLRQMLFKKTLSFSMTEVNDFSISSLITRSTNDVMQVQNIVAMGLQVVIKFPIIVSWAIYKIYDKNLTFTLITIYAVLFLLIMIAIILIFAVPKFKVIQKQTDKINLITRENLIGVRVVRAYNAEKYQENKFDIANKDLTYTHLYTSRIMAIIDPGMTLIMSGLSLAIYWIGAYIINYADQNEKLNIFSDAVVFSSYAVQIIMAFVMLTVIFIMYPRSAVSARRINDVLDKKLSIIDGNTTQFKKSDEGTIEFKNVYFKYSDSEEYVLKNINFTAKKGETVAFVGATGSGKSTLVNLIPRFYDASKGDVIINGINVKEYDRKNLNSILGYVSQKAILFNGTVSFNIGYGSDNDNDSETTRRQKIINSAEIAQCREFIESMDKKYDSIISQGGTNISGGQKQRISIARALNKNPEIFIFDDCFSALDYKTERKVRDLLKHKTKYKTKLLVAQRIGTIKDADKIIVLDKGNIVGIGKHKELMKSCDIYREIAYSQFSKEELENE